MSAAPKIVASKYQLGDCIGKGGFGAVFKGLNIETGDFVAVKRIPLKGVPKEEINGLKSEINLLKKLNHDNITKYVDHHISKDELFIIMEFVENGSLQNVVKKFGTFPEGLVGIYTAQMLVGLAYLHSEGVIHRDIKGANVLTTKTGIIKLADFGVAAKLSEIEPDSVVGTPYWMAPEIIELNPPQYASDIWSLGCTVVELLDGNPPYYELAPMTALFRIVQDEHPPLPTNITPQLKDFLMQCFQKDPNLRPGAVHLLKHKWIQSCRRRSSAVHGGVPGSRDSVSAKTIDEDYATIRQHNKQKPERIALDSLFSVEKINDSAMTPLSPSMGATLGTGTTFRTADGTAAGSASKPSSRSVSPTSATAPLPNQQQSLSMAGSAGQAAATTTTTTIAGAAGESGILGKKGSFSMAGMSGSSSSNAAMLGSSARKMPVSSVPALDSSSSKLARYSESLPAEHGGAGASDDDDLAWGDLSEPVLALSLSGSAGTSASSSSSSSSSAAAGAGATASSSAVGMGRSADQRQPPGSSSLASSARTAPMQNGSGTVAAPPPLQKARSQTQQRPISGIHMRQSSHSTGLVHPSASSGASGAPGSAAAKDQYDDFIITEDDSKHLQEKLKNKFFKLKTIGPEEAKDMMLASAGSVASAGVAGAGGLGATGGVAGLSTNASLARYAEVGDEDIDFEAADDEVLAMASSEELKERLQRRIGAAQMDAFVDDGEDLAQQQRNREATGTMGSWSGVQQQTVPRRKTSGAGPGFATAATSTNPGFHHVNGTSASGGHDLDADHDGDMVLQGALAATVKSLSRSGSLVGLAASSGTPAASVLASVAAASATNGGRQHPTAGAGGSSATSGKLSRPQLQEHGHHEFGANEQDQQLPESEERHREGVEDGVNADEEEEDPFASLSGFEGENHLPSARELGHGRRESTAGMDSIDGTLDGHLANNDYEQLGDTVMRQIWNLSLNAPEEAILNSCAVLLKVFQDFPDQRHQLITHHGLIPMLELLDGPTTSSRVHLALLRVLNQLIADDVKFKENFCLMGGLPAVLKFCSRDHLPGVRAEAAILVREMCSTSTLTLQMFIACRGLPALSQLLDCRGLFEEFAKLRQLVLAALDCAMQVFHVQGRTPKNDFARVFVRSGFANHLADALLFIVQDLEPDQVGAASMAGAGGGGNAGARYRENYIDKCASIVVIFSQGDHVVKTEMSTDRVLRDILTVLDRVHIDVRLKLLKSLKNISMDPNTLDVLQRVGWISKLVQLLSVTSAVLANAAASSVSHTGNGSSIASPQLLQQQQQSYHVTSVSSSSFGSSGASSPAAGPAPRPALAVGSAEADGSLSSACGSSFPNGLSSAVAVSLSSSSASLSQQQQVSALYDNPRASDVHNQVLMTLYNVCRINKVRQEIAAESGVVPCLQRVILVNSPMNQFALPMLCDLAHGSKKCLNELWRHDCVNFYLRILRRQYWQTNALDSLAVWISADLVERKRVESILKLPENVQKIVAAFSTKDYRTFAGMVIPMSKLVGSSWVVAEALSRSEFVSITVRRLREKSEDDPQVRLRLLSILEAMYAASKNPKMFILQHHLSDLVRGIMESDKKVMVKEQARNLLEAFDSNQVL